MRPCADLRSLPLTTEAFRWNTIILIKNKTPPTPPSNASLTRVGLQALYAETLMSYEEFNQMFAQFKEHYWKVSMQEEQRKDVTGSRNLLFKAKAQLPLSLEAFPEVFKSDSFQIHMKQYRI